MNLIYIVDCTSRQHTIEVKPGLTLKVNDLVQELTSENSGLDVILKALENKHCFSLTSDTGTWVFNSANLIGVQFLKQP
jgi:hypothetical protein